MQNIEQLQHMTVIRM